jgi:hypothetical protein
MTDDFKDLFFAMMAGFSTYSLVLLDINVKVRRKHKAILRKPKKVVRTGDWWFETAMRLVNKSPFLALIQPYKHASSLIL